MHELLEHNRKFSKGNKLLPQIREDLQGGVMYGSLACTHLNLAFRCIKNGVTSPVGDLKVLMEKETLKEVVLSGHRWWVLPEDVANGTHIDMSLWRNMDHNRTRQCTRWGSS